MIKPLAFVLFAISLTSGLSGLSQIAPHRCGSSEYRQFDFWLGEWTVRNPKGGIEGSNLVTSEQDGCLIVEHWSSPDQTGVSLNFYDFRTKQWVQQWVDSFGNTLLVKGSFINGRMVLEGDRLTADGKNAHERDVWFVQGDGHVRNVWDYTVDGGKTWVVRFDGIYDQKNPNPSAEQTTSEEALRRSVTRGRSLYAEKRFAEAATSLRPFLSSPEPWSFDWYQAMYELAAYESLAGSPQTGLEALKAAQSNGNVVSAQRLESDPDLAALRKQADFADILAQTAKREQLWETEPGQEEAFAQNLSIDDKVAALSTIWSEARFNFAFFDRHPELNWNQLYLQYIPLVRATQSTEELYRILMRFAAELKDGHTNVYPPAELFDSFYAAPGIRTDLIENKVVVVSIREKSLQGVGWKVGDVITQINGRDVREYAESEVAPYVSASTPQDRDVRVYSYFLLAGDVQVPLSVTVEDAAGHTSIRRLERIPRDQQAVRLEPRRAEKDFAMLPGGVAYLAVNEFEDDAGIKALRTHIDTIRKAKGLIIDIRSNGGGDSEFGYQILRVLAERPFSDSTSRTPLYRAVDRARGATPKTTLLDQDLIPPDPTFHLDLPVAVLTSAKTYSAAEDFVAAYVPMHRGLLVGLPTGGGTGQPFSFQLPGGGSARVCTKNDTAADGTVFEGRGFSPDISVPQSLQDVRSDHDETVERAASALLSLSTR